MLKYSIASKESFIKSSCELYCAEIAEWMNIKINTHPLFQVFRKKDRYLHL